MPLPGFLKSGNRIEVRESRNAGPFVRDHIRMETPPLRHGDVLMGETPMREGDLLFDRAEPPGRKLDLSCEEQKGDNWCWAAVATSLARFYDPQIQWDQCKLANRQLLTDRCCGPDADMTFCDKVQRLDKVLQITGNLVEFIQSTVPPIEPPISFEKVKSEIDNGRAVCSRVEWFDGGGHFQVIIGWKIGGGERYLIISDPIYRETEIVFSSFASRYEGGGKWNVAYFTKPVIADAPPVGIVQVPRTVVHLVVASAASVQPPDIVMVSATEATTEAGPLSEGDESAALFGG